MTEKRFQVYKVSGNFGEWEVEDTLTDTVVMDRIMHKYLADRLCEKLNELFDENKQLKQALREQLEENGNAYCIEILDKIFDLKYEEWQRKMNETHTYDYIDWEKVLKDKGDFE